MREIDEDERREAIDERRRSRTHCKCGNPDWPGSCPGWQFCPVQGEDEPEENEAANEYVSDNGQFGVGA